MECPLVQAIIVEDSLAESNLLESLPYINRHFTSAGNPPAQGMQEKLIVLMKSAYNLRINNLKYLTLMHSAYRYN